MRDISFMKMSAVAVGLAFCVGLSGCGVQDFYENKGGVGLASPETIVGFYKQTASGSIVDTRSNKTLTAGEYLVASISYTNERCHHFFNVLEHFKQDSSLIDAVISAAVTAGAPLLAPVVTSRYVAGFSSALTFGNTYNKKAAEIFAFSDYKEQLMTHVFSAMNSYVETWNSDAKLSLFGFDGDKRAFLKDGSVTSLMVARSMAADYASLCSLAQMRQIVSGALNKSVTKVENSAGFLGPVVGQTQEKGKE